MTSTERVLAALAHQPPDRIPTFDSFWTEFRDQCMAELDLPADVDLADHFGIDIAIAVADETPFPTRVETLRQDGDITVRRDGWGRVLETRKGTFFYRELGTSIEGSSDPERAVFDSPSLDQRYAGFLKQVEEARKAGRCPFCKTGGPFLRTTFFRGETAFLMDIARDWQFARALADRVADHIIQIGLESLRRGQLYDTGLWIYDDMAYNDAPLFSPASFERVFLPAYRRMVAAFKAAGAANVVLHSDGNIGSILDMLVDAGIDGYNPVEPKAGMWIPDLKAKYGDRLALIGGMCNSHVLPQGPPEAIRDQARAIIETGRDGGVMIGAHSIGPDIPVAHYMAYWETVRDEGGYGSGG